jgi:hypothetical protein
MSSVRLQIAYALIAFDVNQVMPIKRMALIGVVFAMLFKFSVMSVTHTDDGVAFVL